MQFLWFRWKRWTKKSASARPAAREAPLRAELFSAEQLRRHAVALADRHRLDAKPAPNRLL